MRDRSTRTRKALTDRALAAAIRRFECKAARDRKSRIDQALREIGGGESIFLDLYRFGDGLYLRTTKRTRP